MAIVRKLEKIEVSSKTKHTETECTYSIVNEDGVIYLQVDTYGSNHRAIKGKKSQSIRFSPEAIETLKEIINAI